MEVFLMILFNFIVEQLETFELPPTDLDLNVIFESWPTFGSWRWLRFSQRKRKSHDSQHRKWLPCASSHIVSCRYMLKKSLILFVIVAEKLETLELSDTDLDLDLVFEALAGNEELSLHRLQSVNFTGNKVPPSAGADFFHLVSTNSPCDSGVRDCP